MSDGGRSVSKNGDSLTIVGFDLNGQFKNDVFRLHMVGANDVANAFSGLGSTATVFITSDLASISVSGKLLGQKVSFLFPP